MSKSLNPGFQPGNNWNTCDRCGFNYRVSQLKKEWTGLMVCEQCWEARHPQDFVRAKKDSIAPSSSGSDSADVFLPLSDLYGDVAIAGIARAGRAITGTS